MENWYIYSNHIRVFCAKKSPHTLPRDVLDRLVLREIIYQITIHGCNVMLNQKQNKTCLTYPITIGIYSFSNFVHAMMKAKEIAKYQLK